jgi:hypothetical protein
MYIVHGVPGGKVDILGGQSVSYSKQKSALFRTVSEIELFRCTDEQHAMSSHEILSALMSTVEFSKLLHYVNCTNGLHSHHRENLNPRIIQDAEM